MQTCIDGLAKKDVAKVQPVLLPVVIKGANDPAPDVREANMGILVSFAVKAGNMALLDKVNPTRFLVILYNPTTSLAGMLLYSQAQVWMNDFRGGEIS